MPNPNKLSTAERSARAKEAFEGANDDLLWQALRAKRLELAIGQAKLQKYGDAFLQELEE